MASWGTLKEVIQMFDEWLQSPKLAPTSLRISSFPPAFCISDKLFWKIPSRPRLMPWSLRGWPKFSCQGQFSWLILTNGSTCGNWHYSQWTSPGREIFQLKAIHPEVWCLPSVRLNRAEHPEFCKFRNEARPSETASHTPFLPDVNKF